MNPPPNNESARQREQTGRDSGTKQPHQNSTTPPAPAQVSGTRWGGWVLHRDTRMLHHTALGCIVELDCCCTSEAVLDTILQWTDQWWVPPKVILDLVRALNDILRPQETLCSWCMYGGPRVEEDHRVLDPATLRRLANEAAP